MPGQPRPQRGIPTHGQPINLPALHDVKWLSPSDRNQEDGGTLGRKMKWDRSKFEEIVIFIALCWDISFGNVQSRCKERCENLTVRQNWYFSIYRKFQTTALPRSPRSSSWVDCVNKWIFTELEIFSYIWALKSRAQELSKGIWHAYILSRASRSPTNHPGLRAATRHGVRDPLHQTV